MSSNIPTFEQYMSGSVTISNEHKELIKNADLSDKYNSISKLTALTTSIEARINELKISCHPHNTISLEKKINCSNILDADTRNIRDFNSLLRTLKQQTPQKKGGRRQTRRHSKHNKNRKQNLKSRRRRNKQA
jgi:hypothetical protein